MIQIKDVALPQTLLDKISDLERRLATVERSPINAVVVKHGYDLITNTPLTTTTTTPVTATIDVPDWANSAFILSWMKFQMSNSTGAVQGQKYRIDIDGLPGSGAWTNDVPAGGTQNVMEVVSMFLNSTLGSTINVGAAVSVHTGTNSANYILVGAVVYFFR